MKPAWRQRVLSVPVALLVCLFVPYVASAAESVAMYRLYNPWTGEHLYTASEKEYSSLPAYGWLAEGWRGQHPLSLRLLSGASITPTLQGRSSLHCQ